MSLDLSNTPYQNILKFYENEYLISSYSFRSKNSVYSVKIEILRFELATISKFKKKKNSFHGNYKGKYSIFTQIFGQWLFQVHFVSPNFI